MPFMLNGKPLAVDRPFRIYKEDGDYIQYPANWLRLASEEDKAKLGIAWEPDAPSKDPALQPKSLEDVVAGVHAAIDQKTREEILDGFEYEGVAFSTSEAAQLNVLGTEVMRLGEAAQFPMGWSTKAGAIHVFKTAEKWQAFKNAAIASISQKKGVGAMLRAEVTALAAEDTVEIRNTLAAWKDPRIPVEEAKDPMEATAPEEVKE
jgi:hypothetical protein